MKKLIIVLFLIGGIFMLKPIDAFLKSNLGNVIHRKNLTTGIVKVVNPNNSFDVEIRESGKTVKKIFTLSPDPDLVVGDKVRIANLHGSKEDPILLAPTKLTPVVVGYLYTIEGASGNNVLVKRNLSDLTVISSVVCIDENPYGKIVFDNGYLYAHTGSSEDLGKWNKVTGAFIGEIDARDYFGDYHDYTFREYSGCGVIGSWVYMASSWNDGFIRLATSLDAANRIELLSNINYGFAVAGNYIYCTGWDSDGDGANAKYDSNGNLIWIKKLADPTKECGYKLGASSYGFVILGVHTDGSDWLRIYDTSGNLIKQINLVTGYSFAASGLTMDSQGNVYFMYGMEFIKKYDSNGNELASCTYDDGHYWIESMAISD